MCVCVVLVFFSGVIKELHVEHESNLVIKIKPSKEWVFHEIYSTRNWFYCALKQKWGGGFASNTARTCTLNLNTCNLVCVWMANIYQLDAIADVQTRILEIESESDFTTQLQIWLICFWWPLINVYTEHFAVGTPVLVRRVCIFRRRLMATALILSTN